MRITSFTPYRPKMCSPSTCRGGYTNIRPVAGANGGLEPGTGISQIPGLSVYMSGRFPTES